MTGALSLLLWMAQAGAEAAAPPAPDPELERALVELSATEGLPVSDVPFARRIDIYGFADFNVWMPMMAKDNPWLPAVGPYSTFAVGNLDLYAEALIAPRWRSMMEVRFLYLPNGNTELASDGREIVVSTKVRDPNQVGHIISWGGIAIERAWIEFQLHRNLTIRAGHFLTPYGIWNVDHGSPVVIGIGLPYVVREAIFPEAQTGFELYGATGVQGWRVGYHLTLSNGRGPADTYRDMDDSKAVGGRLFIEGLGALRATLGGSFFLGKTTDREFRWGPTGTSFGRTMTGLTQYWERSVAADLRLAYGGWLLQSELITSDLKYTDEGRERVPAPAAPGTFAPDARRRGGYVLSGYRTPFFGVMPYLSGEYFLTGSPINYALYTGDLPKLVVLHAGLNVRPFPEIVLKLEYAQVHFPDAGVGSFGQSHIRTLEAQVAWAF